MNGPEYAIVETLFEKNNTLTREVENLNEQLFYQEEQLTRLREQYAKVTGDNDEVDLEDLIDWAIDESERLQAEYTPEEV